MEKGTKMDEGACQRLQMRSIPKGFTAPVQWHIHCTAWPHTHPNVESLVSSPPRTLKSTNFLFSPVMRTKGRWLDFVALQLPAFHSPFASLNNTRCIWSAEGHILKRLAPSSAYRNTDWKQHSARCSKQHSTNLLRSLAIYAGVWVRTQ